MNRLYDGDRKTTETSTLIDLSGVFSCTNFHMRPPERARKKCLQSPGTVKNLLICQRSVKGFLWEIKKTLADPRRKCAAGVLLPPKEEGLKQY